MDRIVLGLDRSAWTSDSNLLPNRVHPVYPCEYGPSVRTRAGDRDRGAFYTWRPVCCRG